MSRVIGWGFVCLLLLTSQAPALLGQAKTVEATGVGLSPEKAKDDALREAITQAVGALVDAETRAEQDGTIKEKILVYSNAFVTSYKRLKEWKEGGIFRCKISAVVKLKELRKRLTDHNILKKVSGSGLAAEARTKQDRNVTGVALFRKALRGFPVNVMDYQAIGTRPQVLKTEGDMVTLQIWTKLQVSLARYNNFARHLVGILDRVGTPVTQSFQFRVEPEDVSLDESKAAAWKRYEQRGGARVLSIPHKHSQELAKVCKRLMDARADNRVYLAVCTAASSWTYTTWRIYALPRQQSVPYLLRLAYTCPRVQVGLLDSSGGQLVQAQVVLNGNTLQKQFQLSEHRTMRSLASGRTGMFFPSPYSEFVNPITTARGRNKGSAKYGENPTKWVRDQSKGLFVISPYLCTVGLFATSGRRRVLPALAFPVQLQLSQSSLEKVTAIRVRYHSGLPAEEATGGLDFSKGVRTPKKQAGMSTSAGRARPAPIATPTSAAYTAAEGLRRRGELGKAVNAYRQALHATSDPKEIQHIQVKIGGLREGLREEFSAKIKFFANYIRMGYGSKVVGKLKTMQVQPKWAPLSKLLARMLADLDASSAKHLIGAWQSELKNHEVVFKGETPVGDGPMCGACAGDGYETCDDCDDDGLVKGTCMVCGGGGKAGCSRCKGRARLKCTSCRQKGKVKKVVGFKNVKCSHCGGSGRRGGYCKACRGAGYRSARLIKWVACKRCEGTLMAACKRCAGKGSINCSKCKGQGVAQVPHAFCGGLKRKFCIKCKGLGVLRKR